MDKRILRKIRFMGQTEGKSMVPVIYPKDGVYIKPTTVAKLKVNDIVTFQQKNNLITHRIIYKKKGYFITKGDNNIKSDGKIYLSAIIGKVDKIKRKGNIFSPESLYLIQSTLYFQEIVKIKRAFEKEKIDFVFLKGLPLHLYFERTHPKRIYADCDVLINKKDFLTVEKIIEKFGYRRTNEKNKQVENNYFKTINGFTVIFDLHLEPAFLMTKFSGLEALYPQKLIDKLNEDLLNNKQQIKINDESFFILDTKYLILYLALHLFHHNFRGTFRYEFLDKIIRKSHSSLGIKKWEEIAQKIKEYRLGNFVYPAFFLLKKHYKTPIPNAFIKSIKYNFISFRDFKNLNIFNEEPRLRAGINRFLNLFLLSPEPWQKKIWVFVNSQVIYSIFWVILKKLGSKIISPRR